MIKVNILYKAALLIVIVIFYLYGSFKHSEFQNRLMEESDQSAYMHYAKELYKARNIDDLDLHHFYVSSIKEFRTNFFNTDKLKQIKLVERELTNVFDGHKNLTLCNKIHIERIIKSLVKIEDSDVTVLQEQLIEILVNSRSKFFGDALDGSRMPLYPMIQSFFYKKKMSDEVFFTIGKGNNIYLSLILLLAISFVFLERFSDLNGVNNVLIITFFMFIFKSSFFQCELLFYFFVFCSFLFYQRCFDKLNFCNSIFAGVFSALAYLTKASVLPGLIIFVFFLTLKILCEQGKKIKITFLFTIIVMFFVIIMPFLLENKKKFDGFFYNINSNVYMWKESWNQIMSEKNKISFKKMEFIDHQLDKKLIRNPQIIINRVISGSIYLWQKSMSTYGYRKYIVIYLFISLILIFLNFRQYLRLAKENIFLVFFLLSFFICYVILYAWYIPIASGNRMILSLFVPFLYVASQTIDQKIIIERVRRSYPQCLPSIVQILILIVIFIDVCFVLTERILRVYGGS